MSDDAETPRITRRFVVSPVGEPNRNGHVYPRALWERVIAEKQPDIDARRMLVTMSNSDGRISYSNPDQIGGIVTKLMVEDNQLLVDVELLNTGLGRVMALPTDRLEVTPSGFGSVDEHGVVRDDYKLSALVVSVVPEPEVL